MNEGPSFRTKLPAPSREWCNFCNDHFERHHFGGDGEHLVGAEYGTFGRLLAIEQTARAFVDAPHDWLVDALELAALRKILGAEE